MIQRWKYKNHSAMQLAVGASVGTFLGYYGYQLTNQWIQKQTRKEE
jgi:hypothetical protein